MKESTVKILGLAAVAAVVAYVVYKVSGGAKSIGEWIGTLLKDAAHPMPPVPGRTGGGPITGRIVDLVREAFTGYTINTEVDNPGPERTVAVQIYGKQAWNIGAGTDSVIDLTQDIVLAANSTTPIPFRYHDVGISLLASWTFQLFADGKLLDTK